jgi:hypothetical protein
MDFFLKLVNFGCIEDRGNGILGRPMKVNVSKLKFTKEKSWDKAVLSL